ncbi:MAG: YdiU family protein [Pseudomonadota bacterium]
MIANLTNPPYATLPSDLHAALPLTEFPDAKFFELNDALRREFSLILDPSSEIAVKTLSGQLSGHSGALLAMAYAGHQFGQYAPRLGDGRAMLIGDVTDQSGLAHELHLKGSGLTPFSRGGDGKATLGAAVREYLISEAMAGLGVATSRSLAILTTGETIIRETPKPGAILARTARSHLRVGTFQYARANHDTETLRALADFAIERLDPELMDAGEDRYAQMLNRVAERQAELIAQWMSFGFIHGVMNTDNMTLSGETIDYGPCAFMDDFHPARVFSSIDYYGRYAWNKQAEIGLWNLSRLAEAILPLFANGEDDQIKAAEIALKDYPDRFKAAWTGAIGRKLGLPSGDQNAFITATLTAFMEAKVDFTRVFTALTRHAGGGDQSAVIAEFETPEQGKTWLAQWEAVTGGRDALSEDTKAAMRTVNPVRIARNHQVEAAIEAAEAGDKAPFEALLLALETPFEEDSRFEAFEAAPQPDEVVHQTFCGT